MTFKEQPVSEGIVQFAPVGEGYFANADISSDGSYTVRTSDGGLPVGEYRVSVLPPTVTTPDTAESPGGEMLKKVDNIPAKYRSPETSELTISVVKGSQTFDISMTE